MGGCLIPEPEETKVVALARKLQAKGVGVRAIAREINQKGYLNRAGQPFLHGSIQQMLRHPLNDPNSAEYKQLIASRSRMDEEE